MAISEPVVDRYIDNPVVSYFVLPCYLNPVTFDVAIQVEGPTPLTTHWGLYLRLAKGEVEWYTDAKDEATMLYLYEDQIKRRFNAPREPHLWKK